MRRRNWIIVALCSALAVSITNTFAADDVSRPSALPEPTTAPSRVAAVTVYRGTALVGRDVTVPEGSGLIELVVTPLPPHTVATSLYTEGADGLRVLSTRFRARAVQADTRAEVRTREDQIKKIQQETELLNRQVQTRDTNLQLLGKLENFTAATMQTMTEKGVFSAESTIAVSKYIMQSREDMSQSQVELQHKITANNDQVAFLQRQLQELAAGSSRTEQDAVIVIDKTNAAAGTVRLNYLVDSATWTPQYKVRAGGEKDPVQVEYLAAIEQQSGEDWTDADVSLSTAEPMLNAAPPELLALEMTTVPTGANQSGSNSTVLSAMNGTEAFRSNIEQSKSLRRQAQEEFNRNGYKEAKGYLNSASALEQSNELLVDQQAADKAEAAASREGPSVTYHLSRRFTLPSRQDQQLIEVARIEMKPDYFYKAVPVLTPHVYRQAAMTNASDYVLLPGEATMYQGKDFVGRMNLPLVAIGETFTAGFGVDPQVQVDRQMTDRQRSVQGGNQVYRYTYRIRISSFKSAPITLQVWDRLPKADSESVGVSLLSQTPDVSKDAAYVRDDRPKNLLRWDLKVDANATGEKAATITYDFKLEYARDVSLGNFKVTN
jgi:uncharacterized protein (TIGR02231 family)